MSDRQTGQTEIPDSWIREFQAHVGKCPTACRGWEKLKSAGLEEAALFYLYGYAGGAEKELQNMHQRTEDANPRMKAAIRARKVAQTGAPKRANNPHLFSQRAADSLQDAYKAVWPAPSNTVRTVGDELRLASKELGRVIPLGAARRALVRAAWKRSPVSSPNFFLFLLRGCAAQHGVRIGVKRLAALAECADPCLNRIQNPTSILARYLRDIPTKVSEGIFRDTLPTLCPPKKQG